MNSSFKMKIASVTLILNKSLDQQIHFVPPQEQVENEIPRPNWTNRNSKSLQLNVLCSFTSIFSKRSSHLFNRRTPSTSGTSRDVRSLLSKKWWRVWDLILRTRVSPVICTDWGSHALCPTKISTLGRKHVSACTSKAPVVTLCKFWCKQTTTSVVADISNILPGERDCFRLCFKSKQ